MEIDKYRERERLLKVGKDRERKRAGDKQWRGEVRGRRGTSGKCAAHLPDGSFGSTQHAVMAVLQYGALPPDCHSGVDTNSAITLLMCEFSMIFFGAGISRQHMVVKKLTKMRNFFYL